MNNFISVLKALADETRFRIINLLLTHDLCVGALSNQLNISKAAVSQHLQILRKAGLVRPDAGKIQIAGINCTGNPKAAQHLTGVVPDENNLYPELTGFDNLCFCAALYGMKKKEREAHARELLETFGLADAAHRKFAGYSRGMKRKLTIAAGIIHNPLILFLDEPTTGIDVASARQIRIFDNPLKLIVFG